MVLIANPSGGSRSRSWVMLLLFGASPDSGPSMDVLSQGSEREARELTSIERNRSCEPWRFAYEPGKGRLMSRRQARQGGPLASALQEYSNTDMECVITDGTETAKKSSWISSRPARNLPTQLLIPVASL